MKNEHLQKNLQKNINNCKINLKKEIKFDNFAKRKQKLFIQNCSKLEITLILEEDFSLQNKIYNLEIYLELI